MELGQEWDWDKNGIKMEMKLEQEWNRNRNRTGTRVDRTPKFDSQKLHWFSLSCSFGGRKWEGWLKARECPRSATGDGWRVIVLCVYEQVCVWTSVGMNKCVYEQVCVWTTILKRYSWTYFADCKLVLPHTCISEAMNECSGWLSEIPAMGVSTSWTMRVRERYTERGRTY